MPTPSPSLEGGENPEPALASKRFDQSPSSSPSSASVLQTSQQKETQDYEELEKLQTLLKVIRSSPYRQPRPYYDSDARSAGVPYSKISPLAREQLASLLSPKPAPEVQRPAYEDTRFRGLPATDLASRVELMELARLRQSRDIGYSPDREPRPFTRPYEGAPVPAILRRHSDDEAWDYHRDRLEAILRRHSDDEAWNYHKDRLEAIKRAYNK